MLHGAKFWFWVVLFVAYSAGAVGVLMVDTQEDRYRLLSKVATTTVNTPQPVRTAGASQVAALYRAQNAMPFTALPAGSTFQVVWPDGSTETMVIVDPTSPNGVRPLRNSQIAAEAPVAEVPAAAAATASAKQ